MTKEKNSELENITKFDDLLLFIHQNCEDPISMINIYNDFSLQYSKEKDCKQKAVRDMVEYLKK